MENFVIIVVALVSFWAWVIIGAIKFSEYESEVHATNWIQNFLIIIVHGPAIWVCSIIRFLIKLFSTWIEQLFNHIGLKEKTQSVWDSLGKGGVLEKKVNGFLKSVRGKSFKKD